VPDFETGARTLIADSIVAMRQPQAHFSGRVTMLAQSETPSLNIDLPQAQPSKKMSQQAASSLDARWLSRLQSKAAASARKRGISFHPPPGTAERLWKDQKGRCAVSGFEFNLERFQEALVKHPYAPSIDRKLSNLGYTRDNVRLVCVAVNFGMGQWGEEVFITLARATVQADKKKTIVARGTIAEWHAQQERRIAAAEEICKRLPPEEQTRQRSRIRGLKAAKTKGPQYMSEIAYDAVMTKRLRRQQPQSGRARGQDASNPQMGIL
jgi:hypothetical protein